MQVTHTYLSDFTGDYAVCRIGMQRPLYGLLDRRGNIIIPPEYKDVYMRNEHKVWVSKRYGDSKTIDL